MVNRVNPENRWPELFTERGNECNEGWDGIIEEFIEKAKGELLANNIKISLIKQKMGFLDIYFTDYTDKLRVLSAELSERGLVTCEVCGAPGKRRGGSWIQILCGEHYGK